MFFVFTNFPSVVFQMQSTEENKKDISHSFITFYFNYIETEMFCKHHGIVWTKQVTDEEDEGNVREINKKGGNKFYRVAGWKTIENVGWSSEDKNLKNTKLIINSFNKY